MKTDAIMRRVPCLLEAINLQLKTTAQLMRASIFCNFDYKQDITIFSLIIFVCPNTKLNTSFAVDELHKYTASKHAPWLASTKKLQVVGGRHLASGF